MRYVLSEYMQVNAYEKLKKQFSEILNLEPKCIFEKNYPRKIWICWLQGYGQAPAIVKVCIDSIKKSFPNKEVVVLTNKSIRDYVKFPIYIEEKYKKGVISAAHYSDLLRVTLLCRYGGAWIDSTVLCTSSSNQANDMINSPLFMFKQLNLGKQNCVAPVIASNWFIVANEQSKILSKVRELLLAYWERYDYLESYYIFHIFLTMASEIYVDEWTSIPMFNNHSPHVLQFELEKSFSEKRWKQICQISDFHKLNRRIKIDENKHSFYQHILNLRNK